MKRGRDWEESDREEKSFSHEVKKLTQNISSIKQCPYLDTINRQMLDFDSEKLCSISLTNRNVYVCLVCGKYFEGRGKSTPAFTHSVEHNHYVFMHVDSGRAYCLPDNYEVLDQSLSDIRRCLQPRFGLQEIASLQQNSALARDVHNVTYLPGYIGLNNLGATDGINAVIHMLAHITPIREFFLQPELYVTAANESKLLRDTGLLLRKLWSSGNFKSTISPQELVQTLSVESRRRYSIGRRCEAAELFVWLLHTLQRHFDQKQNMSVKTTKKVLFECLQGEVQVRTKTKRLVDDFQQQQLLERADQQQKEDVKTDAEGWSEQVQTNRFTFLTLDIPPCPLFRDSHGGFVIPQIPLFQLLQKKFDPHSDNWVDSVTKVALLRRQYRLLNLPNVLIFQLNRFTKNNFTLEKNPTIVTFPVKNLEMKEYLDSDTNRDVDDGMDDTDVQNISDRDTMCRMISRHGSVLHLLEMEHLLQIVKNQNAMVDEETERKMLQDLREVAKRAMVNWQQQRLVTKYDLVTCVCHASDNAASGIEVGDLNLASAVGSANGGNASEGRNKAKARLHHAALSSATNNNNTTSTTLELDEDAVQLGSYKTYLALHATQQWFEMQDLAVSETSAQQVGVSEAYLLVYQKQLPPSSSKLLI